MHGRGVLATNWGAEWQWFCHRTQTISCLCLYRALSSSGGVGWCCLSNPLHALTHSVGPTWQPPTCVLKAANPFAWGLLLSPQGHLSWSICSPLLKGIQTPVWKLKWKTGWHMFPPWKEVTSVPAAWRYRCCWHDKSLRAVTLAPISATDAS